MRPKVVICILFLALGFLGATFVLVRNSGRPTQPIPPAELAAPANPDALVTRHVAKEQTLSPRPVNANIPTAKPISTVPQNGLAQPAPQSAEYARFISERKALFNELSMKSDPESLNILLSSLENPDKQIRIAALEAVIQFDDRSSIPRLEELARQAADPAERRAIEDGIEYMKLPTPEEHFAQRKAELTALAGTNQVRITSHSRSKTPPKKPAEPAQKTP